MKKWLFLFIAIIIFSSHDMYLKLDTYFLQPDTPATIKLFNGTFEKSENVIDRNRMIDVSIVGNGVRERIDSTQWSEKDSMTLLSFKTGAPGTYVAGLSTYARNLEMDAKAFNDYLAHDGVTDMLEWRKANGALEQAANEKYSKHVKTIFQVGDKKTDDWNVNLGYPIEFIPLSNPYNLKEGDRLSVKLLSKGVPLTNQLITIDSKEAHSHGHDHNSTSTNHEHGDTDHGHHHNGSAQVRTDKNGEFTVELTNSGSWFLRTIHMIETTEADLTHESNWATLTFEVMHSHEDDHSHTHEESDVAGLPSYVFWIGSIALVGILFFFFSKKKK